MPHLRATTQQNYRMAFRHVLERPVAKIGHADVAEWVSTLSTTKGPETVSTSTGCLPRRLRDAHASAERQRRPRRPIALPDLRFIQRAMGHESITTTARIYAHLYDDELDAVAAALDGLRKGAS
jgi:integrase